MTPGAPITGILWHQSYRLPKGNTISVFTFTLGCFQFELVYITGWIDMNLLIATRLLHAHVITIVVHVYKVFLDLWLAENETSLNQLSLKYLCCANYFSILKIPREWNVFSNMFFSADNFVKTELSFFVWRKVICYAFLFTEAKRNKDLIYSVTVNSFLSQN